MRRASVGLALLTWLSATVALAHPMVDEGREHFARARFRQALESFARAQEADDLSREDLIALLDARCMVYLAMGDLDSMDYDIERLAAVDPEHRFAPEAPPALQESFDRAVEDSPGPLAVSSTTSRGAAGVTIDVEVSNAPAALEHTVRVYARSEADDDYVALDEPVVHAHPTARVEYYVEVVGLGGAVLVSDGSADEPRAAAAREGASTETEPVDVTDPDDGGISPWVFVIGGVVLLVGGLAGYLLWRRSKKDDSSGMMSPLVIEF